MPLYRNSLSDLIIRTLKVPLQDYKGGTATGGTTLTLIDTSGRTEPDTYFENTTPNTRIRIVTTTDGQAPIGDERRVSVSACTASGTITVPTAWSSSASAQAGDTYALLSEYTWDELREAVNMAIDEIADRAVLPKVDETSLVVQSDVYEYPVPTGFIYIYRATQAEDTGQYLYPIPSEQYRVMRSMGIPSLVFYTHPDDVAEGHYAGTLWYENNAVADRTLRIEGFARQARLVADNDLCYLNPNFVCYRSAQILHSARITHAAGDFDNHRTKADLCEKEANRILAQTVTRLPPNCKKVEW